MQPPIQNTGITETETTPAATPNISKDEIWHQASEMRLTEMAGHWWWLVTAVILVFISPTVVWILAQISIKYPPFPYSTLYLPTVTCLLIGLWLYIYSGIKLKKKINFETRDSEENKINGKNVNEAVWTKFKRGGVNEHGEHISKRFKILISLLRLELFGWIIYTTALTVAIGARINSIAQGGFWAILDESAFDITKATVLAVITLFFTQMLKNYQMSIGKADTAAKIAKEAADKATVAVTAISELNQTAINHVSETVSQVNQGYQQIVERVSAAVDEIKDSRQTLEEKTNELKDVLLSSADALHSEYILKGLRELIAAVAGKANIRQLTEPLAVQINNIGTELNKSKDDELEFTALTVLQSTYFRTESLNFESIKHHEISGAEAEMESPEHRKGCRLSTNYTHYAQAVQAFIETLEARKDETYQYYTLLNVKPEEFFNIENDRVNLLWQLTFLEGHCHKHATKKIGFKRYFTRNAEKDTTGQGKRYPPKYDISSNKDVILCGKEDGNPKLFINPEKLKQELGILNQLNDQREINEEKQAIFDRICLTDSQYEAICNINKIAEKSSQIYTSEPSYIIKVDESNSNDSAIKLKELLKYENVSDLEFKPLKKVLVEKYHNEVTSPKLITFENLNSYDDFFGENIPRDLVAIRSDNEWKLCLGVMIGSDIPTAVTLVFLTKERELNDLSWEELTDKLDILFEKNGKSYPQMSHGDFK